MPKGKKLTRKERLLQQVAELYAATHDGAARDVAEGCLVKVDMSETFTDVAGDAYQSTATKEIFVAADNNAYWDIIDPLFQKMELLPLSSFLNNLETALLSSVGATKRSADKVYITAGDENFLNSYVTLVRPISVPELQRLVHSLKEETATKKQEQLEEKQAAAMQQLRAKLVKKYGDRLLVEKLNELADQVGAPNDD